LQALLRSSAYMSERPVSRVPPQDRANGRPLRLRAGRPFCAPGMGIDLEVEVLL